MSKAILRTRSQNPSRSLSKLAPACSRTIWRRFSGGVQASDLKAVQVRDAGFHQVEVHFHEIVLYTAGFRRGEDFLPVERILAYGDDFPRRGVPPLDVHRKKSPGIFVEIFCSVVAVADGGDLELEFNELGI